MLRQQLEDATKQKIKPLADQVKSLQEQLKQLRQQLKGMRATGGSKGDKGSKERHEPGRDDLQQQIHQIEQQIHEVQQQIRAQLDAQKGTRTELAQVLAKLRELRKGSEALQKQLRPLQQAEMELRAKLAGLNHARKEAWQQVEAAQKAHDHDAELAALNRASGLEQEVRGIYQQILAIKRKVGAVVQAAR